jgi:hypothetical protein
MSEDKVLTDAIQDVEEKKSEQFFRHESYTSGTDVTIEILTPVKVSSSGKTSVIKDMDKIFIGKTFISVAETPTPYTFRIIEADNLRKAIDVFESSLEKALEETRKEVEELQKKRENQIVTPDSPGGIIQP